MLICALSFSAAENAALSVFRLAHRRHAHTKHPPSLAEVGAHGASNQGAAHGAFAQRRRTVGAADEVPAREEDDVRLGVHANLAQTLVLQGAVLLQQGARL